jgi:hypothetical protein
MTLHSLEEGIRRIAIDARAAYQERLTDLGLEAKIDLRKDFREGVLDAELRITFLRDGNLVDALEGFVIKGSQAAVSNEELGSWLHEGMRDVLAKHQSV